MKKTQDEAQVAAAESHRRNGTYRPKGFRIPGSENNGFKKDKAIRIAYLPKDMLKCRKTACVLARNL